MSDAAAATADAGSAGNGAAAVAGAALLNGNSGGNGSSRAATVDTGSAGDAGKNGSSKDSNGDWRSMFAQGLDEPAQKQWSSLTGRYQSPAEFAKAHLELRNTAIFVPKDDKPEAWDQVYDRLGRPKDAKEYKWNHLPDAPPLDEAEQQVRNNDFAPVMHRLGISQRQADGVIQWHDQQRKVQTDAAIARANTTTETYIKTLKAEWGPDYDRNVANHQSALRHYAGNDFKTVATLRLADGTFVADHPVIARMMSKIGAERAEDNRFAESFNPSSVADAKAQIAKIEGEAVANGLNPTSANWPHAQLDPLYARISGSKRMSPGEQFMR